MLFEVRKRVKYTYASFDMHYTGHVLTDEAYQRAHDFWWSHARLHKRGTWFIGSHGSFSMKVICDPNTLFKFLTFTAKRFNWEPSRSRPFDARPGG